MPDLAAIEANLRTIEAQSSVLGAMLARYQAGRIEGNVDLSNAQKAGLLTAARAAWGELLAAVDSIKVELP